jgi:hypothetical protein
MFSYYTCLEFDFFPEEIFYKKTFFLSSSISLAYKRPKFLEIIEHYWYKYVYSMGSIKLRRGASAESPERTGEKKIWGIP